MSAVRLLTYLRSLGVTLAPEGNALEYDAPESVMTPERLDALRQHEAEIMRLLAAEAAARGHADGDRSTGATSPPSAGAGCSITRDGRHDQHTLYDVVPHDAGRLLLAWGADQGYPPLPLKPGVGIAAGEMRWLAFVSWATADLLALAVEQVQAASSRRCVVHGCRSACAHGDPVYCQAHRQQADLGLLWAPFVGSDTTQDALHGPSEAPGATKGQEWTQGQGPSATRTDVLRSSVASEDYVDVVIEPSGEPSSSGTTFMVLLDMTASATATASATSMPPAGCTTSVSRSRPTTRSARQSISTMPCSLSGSPSPRTAVALPRTATACGAKPVWRLVRTTSRSSAQGRSTPSPEGGSPWHRATYPHAARRPARQPTHTTRHDDSGRVHA